MRKEWKLAMVDFHLVRLCSCLRYGMSRVLLHVHVLIDVLVLPSRLRHSFLNRGKTLLQQQKSIDPMTPRLHSTYMATRPLSWTRIFIAPANL